MENTLSERKSNSGGLLQARRTVAGVVMIAESSAVLMVLTRAQDSVDAAGESVLCLPENQSNHRVPVKSFARGLLPTLPTYACVAKHVPAWQSRL